MAKKGELVSEEHDVLLALDRIRRVAMPALSASAAFQELMTDLERLQWMVHNNRLQEFMASPSRWANTFCRWGQIALLIIAELNKPKQKQFDEQAFAALIVQKNRRYGAKPIRDWGELGVAIRIHSKASRYETLIQQPDLDNMQDESITDTVTDILGYSVLGLLLASEKIAG